MLRYVALLAFLALTALSCGAPPQPGRGVVSPVDAADGGIHFDNADELALSFGLTPTCAPTGSFDPVGTSVTDYPQPDTGSCVSAHGRAFFFVYRNGQDRAKAFEDRDVAVVVNGRYPIESCDSFVQLAGGNWRIIVSSKEMVDHYRLPDAGIEPLCVGTE